MQLVGEIPQSAIQSNIGGTKSNLTWLMLKCNRIQPNVQKYKIPNTSLLYVE